MKKAKAEEIRRLNAIVTEVSEWKIFSQT
jgi:hypothetical protein